MTNAIKQANSEGRLMDLGKAIRFLRNLNVITSKQFTSMRGMLNTREHTAVGTFLSKYGDTLVDNTYAYAWVADDGFGFFVNNTEEEAKALAEALQHVVDGTAPF